MKYSCDHCPYETDKKANYVRHLNRKFRCSDNGPRVKVISPEVKVGSSTEGPEVMDEGPEVKGHYESELSCKHCNKTFSNLRKLRNHKDVCRGKLSILQCEICHKTFTCKQSKYEHKRNVLCYPPPPPDYETPPENNVSITKESAAHMPTTTTTSSVITTNHSHNNNQNTTNSHNNTVNNIINFNSFGDEGIEQLGKFLSYGKADDSKIIERMRQLGKKKIYGIRDMQNDIFFNPDNPEGFSIIKPEKYGSSVRVRNSEGEFEYREFEDVRDPLLNYMEKYIDIYNKTRNKYNVKFRDPKERKILHNFFKIMNDNLEIYLGEDLKEDLNIQDNIGEEDKYKQFDKVSLDNIHVQTKKYFKCKKGEFVLKEMEHMPV